MHQLLRAVSVTLQHVVQADLATDPRSNGAPIADGVLGPPPLVVSIESPRTIYGRGDDAVSVWLHRVVPDLRSAPQGSSAGGGVRPLEPALRLHYVVTPIVADDRRGAAETTQYLLGRILWALHAQPVLQGPLLQGELAGTTARLAVTPDPMDVDALLRLWTAIQLPYRPCATYEVTLSGPVTSSVAG